MVFYSINLDISNILEMLKILYYVSINKSVLLPSYYFLIHYIICSLCNGFCCDENEHVTF